MGTWRGKREQLDCGEDCGPDGASCQRRHYVELTEYRSTDRYEIETEEGRVSFTLPTWRALRALMEAVD